MVTYSLTQQRLFGRFKPRNNYLFGVEETAPRVRDLGGLSSSGPLSPLTQFGVDPSSVADYASSSRGEIDELVSLRLAQSYNLLSSDKRSKNSNSPISDVGAALITYPNEYIRFKGQTDFNAEKSTFDAYTLESQLSNKRGDMLRTRLRFNNNSNSASTSAKDLRQLESSFEFGLNDRVRLGYYSRWDDVGRFFREQKAGVRLMSSCNCWMVDFLVSDQYNPDNTRLSFNVTLLGLGQLGNTFFTSVSGKNNNLNTPIGP